MTEHTHPDETKDHRPLALQNLEQHSGGMSDVDIGHVIEQTLPEHHFDLMKILISLRRKGQKALERVWDGLPPSQRDMVKSYNAAGDRSALFEAVESGDAGWTVYLMKRGASSTWKAPFGQTAAFFVFSPASYKKKTFAIDIAGGHNRNKHMSKLTIQWCAEQQKIFQIFCKKKHMHVWGHTSWAGKTARENLLSNLEDMKQRLRKDHLLPFQTVQQVISFLDHQILDAELAHEPINPLPTAAKQRKM